jgi:hypothetical protein
MRNFVLLLALLCWSRGRERRRFELGADSKRYGASRDGA